VTEKEWDLASGIVLAIRELEDKHDWSMSPRETARFAKVLYEELIKGFPTKALDLVKAFQRAAVNTWGDTTTYEIVEFKELFTLMQYIEFCYEDVIDINYSDIKKLLAQDNTWIVHNPNKYVAGVFTTKSDYNKFMSSVNSDLKKNLEIFIIIAKFPIYVVESIAKFEDGSLHRFFYYYDDVTVTKSSSSHFIINFPLRFKTFLIVPV